MLFALAILTVCLFFAVLFGFFALAALHAGFVVMAIGTSAIALLLVVGIVMTAWTAIREGV